MKVKSPNAGLAALIVCSSGNGLFDRYRMLLFEEKWEVTLDIDIN